VKNVFVFILTPGSQRYRMLPPNNLKILSGNLGIIHLRRSDSQLGSYLWVLSAL